MKSRRRPAPRPVDTHGVEELLRRVVGRLELLAQIFDRQAIASTHGYQEDFGPDVWGALADVSREGAREARVALAVIPTEALNLAAGRTHARGDRS